MYRSRIGFVLGLLLVTSAWAGVVPGKWEKVQAEKPGTEMIITMSSGDVIRGEYQEVGDEELLMTVEGESRAVPKSAIAKITTAERRTGPLWNGPVIGAAVGGGLAGIVAAGLHESEGAAAAIGLCALIGAGIGLGADAAYQTRITLYQAPGVE